MKGIGIKMVYVGGEEGLRLLDRCFVDMGEGWKCCFRLEQSWARGRGVARSTAFLASVNGNGRLLIAYDSGRACSAGFI